MTQVSVDKALAEELVDLKLQYIARQIKKNLKKWKQETPEVFFLDAENGALPEPELHAITSVHRVDQREELFEL